MIVDLILAFGFIQWFIVNIWVMIKLTDDMI